jgi:hypothetical protein
MKLKNWFKATGVILGAVLGSMGIVLGLVRIGPQGLGMITVICMISALIYWLKTVFDAHDKQKAEKLLHHNNMAAYKAPRTVVRDLPLIP